jgi:hypothetical protein
MLFEGIALVSFDLTLVTVGQLSWKLEVIRERVLMMVSVDQIEDVTRPVWEPYEQIHHDLQLQIELLCIVTGDEMPESGNGALPTESRGFRVDSERISGSSGQTRSQIGPERL